MVRNQPADVRLTLSAYAIARLVAMFASLVFAATCGGRSSPTAADGTLQLRFEGMVTDEVLRPLSGATIRVLEGPMAGTRPSRQMLPDGSISTAPGGGRSRSK